MNLTILGSGTSHGVPVIGCTCAVCRSADPKDNRLRCSALLSHNEKNYLIDVGPDFRQQALRIGLSSLDSVFLTHSHADHIHGIDDLRIFSHKNSRAMNEDKKLVEKYPETAGEGLPIYSSQRTADHIKSCFKYIFIDHDKGGGIPKLNFIPVDEKSVENPLQRNEISVVPVPMIHGNHHTTGWVFSAVEEDGKKHSIAYLTDCSYISDSSVLAVKQAAEGGVLDHLVIDALRIQPHSSHNNFDQALSYGEQIGALHTWFTHMTHDNLHGQIQEYINSHLAEYEKLSEIVKEGGSVSPAFDGLVLKIN